MIESRSTGPSRLQAARVLASLGLISLLGLGPALINFAQPDLLALLALAPLLVASFRHPVLGRILGWAGVLAQIATLVIVR